jgi:hypothetical protein
MVLIFVPRFSTGRARSGWWSWCAGAGGLGQTCLVEVCGHREVGDWRGALGRVGCYCELGGGEETRG